MSQSPTPTPQLNGDAAAHTPGPWFADHEGTIKRQRYDDDGNPDGYELLDGVYPGEWAAAPDLLAACRTATSFLNDGYPPEEISPAEVVVREAIEAAIAKATGGAA